MTRRHDNIPDSAAGLLLSAAALVGLAVLGVCGCLAAVSDAGCGWGECWSLAVVAALAGVQASRQLRTARQRHRWQGIWYGHRLRFVRCPVCQTAEVDERGVCHTCGCTLLQPPPLPRAVAARRLRAWLVGVAVGATLVQASALLPSSAARLAWQVSCLGNLFVWCCFAYLLRLTAAANRRP
ncbi:MAG: hypothetical protein IT204_04155 [Fimbriimonadaceae bacterium]|nr:hypothetical protein [Fimbriimonadaceae bacterium]